MYIEDKETINKEEIKMNLKTKIKIVENGGSEVFNNWSKWGLITMEEFIDALKWLEEDPYSDYGTMTREVALELTPDAWKKAWGEVNEVLKRPYDENNVKSKIIKLERVYNKKDFVGFYRIDNRRLWTGNWDMRLNAESRV